MVALSSGERVRAEGAVMPQRLGNPPVCLLLGFFLLSAVCFPQGTPSQNAQNRRILDIELLTYPDSYRIRIHLNELTSYQITNPRAGRPLKVELNQTDADAALVPTPESNELIQRVWITPGQSGVALLEFPLAASQIEVTDWTVLTPAPTIVINLKLRPGVTIPSATAKPETVALPPTKDKQEEPFAANSASKESTPAVALPPPTQTPAPAAPSPEQPAPPPSEVSALPPPTAAPVSLPEASPTVALPKSDSAGASVPDEKKMTDIVFASESFGFRKADQMLTDYAEHRYGDALKIGLDALSQPQPQSSLDTLLYFLAECRYQLELARSLPTSQIPPNWEAALNFSRQARRNNTKMTYRPFVDRRISQILGELGRLAEQKVILSDLLDEGLLADEAQLLMANARACLRLYDETRACADQIPPAALENLAQAKSLLQTFVRKYPDASDYADAFFLLGVIAFREGDNASAYETMQKAVQAALKKSGASSFQVDPRCLCPHGIGRPQNRKGRPGPR